MTHVDLELKLANSTPKCANCRHFVGEHIGQCVRVAPAVAVQDLSVCSGWELATDPVIEVRKV